MENSNSQSNTQINQDQIQWGNRFNSSGWIFLPFVLPWVVTEGLNCIFKFYGTWFQNWNFPELQQFVVFHFSPCRFVPKQVIYTLEAILFPVLMLMLCLHNCQDKWQLHQISLPNTLKHHSQCLKRAQRSVPLPASLKCMKMAMFFSEQWNGWFDRARFW